MQETIVRQLNFNLAYARKLVEDVSEKEMTICPSLGLENHPAFTLGHLIMAAALTVKYLGGIFEVPEGWEEIFMRKGPGDPRMPEKDATKYPSKIALLEELDKQHRQIIHLLLNTDIHNLNEQPKQWRFSDFMPSLLDAILFMCVNHEAMHLGQLAAWRRAMNKPSALGAM